MTNSNTPRRRSLLKGAAVAAGALSAPMVATAQTTTSLRFQSTWPAKDIFHEYAQDFAKKVNDMASGRLKIEVLPDEAAGRVNVNVRGGGLGSVVDLTAGANVLDNGDGTTTLDWTGEASMRGPVASVGGRMLDVQAKKLIEKTFENMGTAMSAAGGTLA